VNAAASPAYTADAHSATLSSYRVGPQGDLQLVAGLAASTGGVPLDLIVGADQSSLYILNTGTPMIQVAGIRAHGSLGAVMNTAAVPASATGPATFGR